MTAFKSLCYPSYVNEPKKAFESQNLPSIIEIELLTLTWLFARHLFCFSCAL